MTPTITAQPSTPDAPAQLRVIVNDPTHQPPTTVLIGGHVAILFGENEEPLCAACMERLGDCALTGGTEHCDGQDAIREAAAAPWLAIRVAS
jgi:hypothetical protein